MCPQQRKVYFWKQESCPFSGELNILCMRMVIVRQHQRCGLHRKFRLDSHLVGRKR